MKRRLAFSIMALAAALPTSVQANFCAVPGQAGSAAALAGVVNSYYPGTATVNAGGTAITLGVATGAAQAIAVGDLLLVIQMQDATISTLNSDAYGDNVAGGRANGVTAIQQTGRYEYVRATSAVGATGGTVTITGATGGGLANLYRHTAAGATTAKASFQVIRVPQYNDATISGVVLAAPWNGTSGGVLAIDVAGKLTFSGGSIDASGRGFRGGGARRLAGGTGTNADFRTLASVNTNGAKGEGVAGTPRFTNNVGVLQDLGVEGYANGSNGRGAPGNAGGGGTDGNPVANDQNPGGGGGGNGGAGGVGGHAWCPAAPVGCPQTGGQPGSSVERGVDRVVMGGGGGAGSTNDGTGNGLNGFASSGAAGGGIVMVRAGELVGAAVINANGENANNTVLNDGSGGGGAGGSIFVSAVRVATGATLTARANGGTGGTNTGNGAAHGPGGGGGGGFVATSMSSANSVVGGSAGTTANGGTFGAQYGATPGAGGNGISITGASIPGLSSGGECTPTVVKAFSVSPITPGTPTRMSILVTNNNPTTALTALAFTDTYPAGLINTATPAAAKDCVTAATLAAAANGGTFAISSGVINAASSCTYSVNTTATSVGNKTNILPAGSITGSFGTSATKTLVDVSAIVVVSPPLTVVKASQAYSDPVNGLTNPKMIPGGLVNYTITVSNTASYTVTSNSVVVVDATPARLRFFVGGVNGGTAPILFRDGTTPSGLTFTYTDLASQTDDVSFSNDGGTTWTYVPAVGTSQVDPAVTHIRVSPRGPMNPGTNFALVFAYRIN